jgi:hypothetical protein
MLQNSNIWNRHLKSFTHERQVRGLFSTIWFESYFFSLLLPNNGKIKIQKHVAACICVRM